MEVTDLYTVDRHSAGAEMQVYSESGEALELYLTVIGVDSKEWRKLVSGLTKRLVDGDDDDLVQAETLASATLSWRGFESKGKALKFSTESATNLYLNAPYIRNQVDAFIASRANFTKGKEA